MSEQILWFASRGSGIVSLVLSSAVVEPWWSSAS